MPVNLRKTPLTSAMPLGLALCATLAIGLAAPVRAEGDTAATTTTGGSVVTPRRRGDDPRPRVLLLRRPSIGLGPAPTTGNLGVSLNPQPDPPSKALSIDR